MTPDPYRVAFETALTEITEITAKFEQLRLRKGQIENLITALQPVFAEEAGSSATVSAAQATQSALQEENEPQLVSASETAGAQDPANFSYLDVPNPLPEGDGDPFQRRVKTSFRFRGLATQRS